MQLETIWDDPANGLTVADFTKWPGRRLNRDKYRLRLQQALDINSIMLPVHLVGECTTYDIAHGHPSFQGAVHEAVFFVVSGRGQPVVVTLRSKGFGGKRTDVHQFPAFDEYVTSTVDSPHGGYLDVQMKQQGVPTGLIGFIFSFGGHDVAELRRQRFIEAAHKAIG